MSIRILAAFAISAFVTIGLFGFIHAVTDDRLPVPVPTQPIPVRPPSQVAPPEPQEPPPAPLRPPLPRPSDRRPIPVAPPPLRIMGPGPPLPFDLDPNRESGDEAFRPDSRPERGDPRGSGDRSALPLVRIAPQYPPQAVERGLEGWVVVRFTVAADGSVRDATAVAASDPVFEREAIRAVSRFKYQPQIEAGRVVESLQELTLRFSLDE